MPHSPQLKPHQFQAQTPPDQYSAYADNFDLSLLPQESAPIPTTVFQYNAPQIKVECAWESQPIQQQQQQQQQPSPYPIPSSHQLIPPPAYPHSAYPSPQSSPLQSEFAAYGFGRFGGSYDSLNSPSPSLEAVSIKQELHILPPSPPESNCETPSPRSSCGESIKAEPLDADIESLIDLNSLLQQQSLQSPQNLQTLQDTKPDHQLLRECLEDTSFQKRHNLKPLALESFIGGLAEVRGDFEPVISLALEHAKREADAICAELQISQGELGVAKIFLIVPYYNIFYIFCRSQWLVARPSTRMATIHLGPIQIATGGRFGAALLRRWSRSDITQRGGIRAPTTRGKSKN